LLHVGYISAADQLSVFVNTERLTFILFSISECTKTDNRSLICNQYITISDEVTELAKEDARSWRQDFREEIAEIDAMVEIEVKAA